jgi:serine/threonine protein kinase
MHQLPDHSVRPEDIHSYAVSLIKSAISLQEAGILHCDITPHTVLWNSRAKVACLADFGSRAGGR